MNTLLTNALRQIFRRDLLKLRQEIVSYQDDDKIWTVEKNISNSAGNLCLHLVGNLNTYIGAQLGGTGYVRNREAEFADKGLSREELIQKIEQTIEVVDATLATHDDTLLQQTYPTKVFAEPMSTGFFLIHLTSHLGYHLGQINYHRRLLDTRTIKNFGNVYARAFC